MKRYFFILIWVIFVTGIIVLLGFVNAEHKNSKCNDFNVSINLNNSGCFITEDEIKSQVYQSFDSLKGKLLSEINTEDIESMINKDPYIEQANVYFTVNGKLKIDVVQRKPVVRVITKSNHNFYIDDNGVLMPLNKDHVVRVLIASGNIGNSLLPPAKLKLQSDSLDKNRILFKIYSLAKFINKNKFLNTQIEQIYINKENGIELIPKVGKHLILFGDIDNMEEKFENLIAFYKKGLSKVGWDKYKKINLKYKNQVVCTKN